MTRNHPFFVDENNVNLFPGVHVSLHKIQLPGGTVKQIKFLAQAKSGH